METALETVIKDILLSIYSPFGFALLLSFLFMFFYMECEKNGVRETIRLWKESFKKDSHFKALFWFGFYTAMMLSWNFFCNSVWLNPINEVLKGWQFRKDDGSLSENVVIQLWMYLPFIFLLFRAEKNRIFQKITWATTLYHAFIWTFGCSVCTEFLQLLFRLQYVRISDVVYNVIGGLCGGILFYFVDRKRK